jgi:thiol-disulfide isomerase/thioredoxin
VPELHKRTLAAAAREAGGADRLKARVTVQQSVERFEVSQMPRRGVSVAGLLAALLALAGCGGKGLAPTANPGQVREVASTVTVIPAAQRRPLPAFAGPTLDGGRLDLAAFRGRTLVLNFWASWCGPCRAEQAGLDRASRQLAGRGVRLVGVNIADDPVAAAAYVAEFKVGYPSLVDKPAVLPARLRGLGPPAPPYTLVVDRQGRVAARVLGALPGGRPEVQAAFLADVVGRVSR